MECPKCKAALRDEISPGRGAPGSLVKVSKIQGYTCWCCGFWLEADVVPEKPMSKEQWARKPVGKHVGVARGTCRSDAAPLAVSFFDNISDLLKQSASWRSISILVKAAVPEARFDVKSLKKFYGLELDKRGGMTA